jgi:serine/threonine-protein kinase
MLRGLHEAHVAVDAHSGLPLGVVHRDVSPHNVMVDGRGAVKIIDFGLATSVVKQTMTESAVVLGKTAYMAPEQARGEVSTPATDQYAAAIVAYELLTGDRFYGDLPSRAVWSIVGSGRHRPRDLSSLPPAVGAVLLRALAPEPADRFSSCAAFAEALLAAAPQAASAAATQRVGALVQSLAVVEQQTIAQARELAAQLLPTARPELEDATQSMRFRVTQQGSWRPTPSSLSSTEMPTMATARLRPAPPAPLPAPSQRRWLAAAAGGGLLLTLLVGGAWMMRRAAPATATTTTSTTTAPSSPPPAVTATTPTPTTNATTTNATTTNATTTNATTTNPPTTNPPTTTAPSPPTPSEGRPVTGAAPGKRGSAAVEAIRKEFTSLRQRGCQEACAQPSDVDFTLSETTMRNRLERSRTQCANARGLSP